jgi:trehalose 6-phosphate phosphatase
VTAGDATTSTPWVDVDGALADVAQTPRLLVVCDFDGTIAPIVDDPSAAAPDPLALELLLRLAALPGTVVALVSGRSRAHLATLSGLGTSGSPVRLVGSHGAEHADAERPEGVRDIIDLVRVVAEPFVGVELEPKPYGVAVHVRRADEPDAALAAVAAFAASHELTVLHGKKVIELSVAHVDKGDAVRRLVTESLADRTVIVGDDVTDEAAFAAALAEDVTVKVGAGETTARYRVRDVGDVVLLLQRLLEVRTSWASSAHGPA